MATIAARTGSRPVPRSPSCASRAGAKLSRWRPAPNERGTICLSAVSVQSSQVCITTTTKTDASGILPDVADAYVHPSAVVDKPGTHLGADTKVWHFAHVIAGAWIGDRCVIGHACYIGKVRIGHGCHVQNHVSIFD